MSPQAEALLIGQIVPRLRVLIPQSVPQIGHEDHDELVQDSTVMAVKMLTSAESKGKRVSAGNIAYFTVLHARSGRRSYAAGSSDVLHPRNRMSLGEPESFDETVKEDDCGGESMVLADVFTNDSEDPSTQAARTLDWAAFTATLNDRCRMLLQTLVEGGSLKRVADRLKISASTLNTARQQLRNQAVAFFGPDILSEIVKLPQWRNNLQAHREMLACREERVPA